MSASHARLVEAFPSLDRVPHVALGTFPTPVEPLPLAGVLPSFGGAAWVKREDRAAAALGGNKVRKLEYLLADARARDAACVLTAGGIGSNHCLATTFYAPEVGLDVELVLFPHDVTPSTQRTLRAICSLGPRITVAPSSNAAGAAAAARAAWLQLRARRPYGILPGGSSVTGTLGWVAAGLELAAQIRDGELDEPDAVWCAYSSGGTAAGLSVGLQAAGVRSRVVAVQVYPPPLTSTTAVRLLAKRTAERLGPPAPGVAPFDEHLLDVRSGYLGDGYAVPTEAGGAAKDVARELGFTLEATYTAKAFAAFLDAAARSKREDRLVFVLTYDPRIPDALADPPPPELVPPRLRDYV